MASIYKALIITPKTPTRLEILNPGYLVVSKEGSIEEVTKRDPRRRYKNHRFVDHSDKLIIPGLVDSHNHLPQYAFAGIGGKELLSWLKTYTFPRETLFKDSTLATEAAKVFFKDLIKNGTTTTATYVTIHKGATEAAFMAAKKAKIRALIGKVMMDRRSPRALSEKTATSLAEAQELIDRWHDPEGRLQYILTPRFALSCSAELMEGVARLAREKNLPIQTHLSENLNEIAAVKKLFPKAQSYTDLYNRLGLLGSKTLMAHGVHLSPAELKLLKKTQTTIVHCPTSNRFLMSGTMPFRSYQKLGVKMALGSDVAGGYSLSLFNEMREAIESSKSLAVSTDGKSGAPMTLAEAVYLATLGGARAVGLGEKVGSLHKGKNADFLVIDYRRLSPMGADDYEKPEQILSRLIYRGGPEVITGVFIGGEKV